VIAMRVRVYSGLVKYNNGLNEQKLAVSHLIDTGEPTLLIMQHTSVYTKGSHFKDEDQPFSDDMLRRQGAEVFDLREPKHRNFDRIGSITYHGPGQIVAYPIFHAGHQNQRFRRHIRLLENVSQEVLSEYGIEGHRVKGSVGVWVGDEGEEKKIVAVGPEMMVDTNGDYITRHGFALNVNTDLSYFDLINPCGHTDKGMTSMQEVLGREVDVEDVMTSIRNKFAGRKRKSVNLEQVLQHSTV
jgi:lipoyl(octanoyl) transferase